MHLKISKVFLFNTAQIAVFDERGEQIPELQTALIVEWAEKAKALGYEIDGLEIQIQADRNIRLFEWEFEGETGINFEVV